MRARNSTWVAPTLPSPRGGGKLRSLAAKLRRLWRGARDGGDPDVALAGVAGGKGQQSLAFLRHGDPVGLRQTAQWRNRQHGRVPSTLDRPGAVHKPVDQKCAGKDDVAIGVIDDASAVV